MRPLVCWILGLLGAAGFSVGMAGAAANLMLARLPLPFGWQVGLGWLVPCLSLLVAAASWGGSWLIWEMRPRPGPLRSRRPMARIGRRRRT